MPFITIVLVALLGLGCCAYQEGKEFEQKIIAEHKACIEAGESEYTCRAYIESMKASRSAAIATGVSAGAMGFAAGSAAGR